MFTRFAARGFKTLHDVSVPLGQITVLVGANNSGKSNIVRALSLLAESVGPAGFMDAVRQHGDRSQIGSRDLSIPLELEVSADIGGDRLQYGLKTSATRVSLDHPAETFARTDSGGTRTEATLIEGREFHMPGLAVSWEGLLAGQGLRAVAKAEKGSGSWRSFYDALRTVRVADFSAVNLRAASQISGTAELTESGENLAAVLDRLAGERPDIWDRINEEVRRAVPGIDKVVLPPAAEPGTKVVGVAEGKTVYRAEHISEGVLYFIALSTISQMSGPTLVCLEEPEKGIHPRRIRELIDQVRRVARTGTQFLITTHSPVLLDEFRDEPESVLIVERDEKGTHVTPLSDRTDVLERVRDVSLGDLWFSGVLGGVPA